ncbi:hypothetical protein KKF84_13800 [Myxococcota bacterium]|nr:hypothetical protein [Myxococcota bacterium]
MKSLHMILLAIILSGCNLVVELKDPPVDCGDGFVHGDEVCDGDQLRGQTCLSLGYSGGDLSCNDNCTLNTMECLAPLTCGNGTIEVPETCDGSDLAGSCEDLGYYGGTLLCDTNCRHDTSNCEIHGRCGDGVSQSEESCDGDDLEGETCETLGFYGGQLACAATCTFDLTDCETSGRCGDGTIQQSEECDGSDFGSTSCESLGFPGGLLACSDDCTITTAGCFTPLTCGDSTIQAPEQCDGSDLAGETCITRGFYGGTLLCGDNCAFDLSNCALTGRCGDNLRQDTHEDCDGSDLGGSDCESLGYYGGTLSCLGDCTYDLTQCTANGWCGDGEIQAGGVEVCDSTELSGMTCSDFGYYGGDLLCDSTCQYDLTQCVLEGKCGDGIAQTAYVESCDGTDFAGVTCEGLSYYGGQPTCDASCQLDLSDCVASGSCGDGLIQTAALETCDGTELGGESCGNLGYYGGTLGCDSSCHLDLTSCEAAGQCGDNLINGTETCDGTDLDGQTCQTMGYYGGTLGCDAFCTLDLTDCIGEGRCGDGIIQSDYAETCDGTNLGGNNCALLGFWDGTLTCDATCQFVTTGCN